MQVERRLVVVVDAGECRFEKQMLQGTERVEKI